MHENDMRNIQRIQCYDVGRRHRRCHALRRAENWTQTARIRLLNVEWAKITKWQVDTTLPAVAEALAPPLRIRHTLSKWRLKINGKLRRSVYLLVRLLLVDWRHTSHPVCGTLSSSAARRNYALSHNECGDYCKLNKFALCGGQIIADEWVYVLWRRIKLRTQQMSNWRPLISIKHLQS